MNPSTKDCVPTSMDRNQELNEGSDHSDDLSALASNRDDSDQIDGSVDEFDAVTEDSPDIIDVRRTNNQISLYINIIHKHFTTIQTSKYNIFALQYYRVITMHVIYICISVYLIIHRMKIMLPQLARKTDQASLGYG